MFDIDFSAIKHLIHALKSTPDTAIAANMAFALVLGFLFGYERSYHGRAAGMRTYGLVCMVSAALTSSSVYYGTDIAPTVAAHGALIDPTRTIQGVVTGIGFLCAGIIMKDGLKISGLTTSASIWAAAAIGILIGLEYYVAALMLTLFAEVFVLLGSRFDIILPSRRPIYVSLQFQKGFLPKEEMVQDILAKHRYEIAKGSVSIMSHSGLIEWRFVAISMNRRRDIAISELAERLPLIEGLDSFHISRARN
jgi:putative Mg2+ transporter-C (MgtC) family protein